MPVAFRTGLRLRASKPGGAFQEIDWGHPLAIGLRAYVPLTEGRGVPMELVSRTRADNAALAYVENPTSSQNGWVGVRSTLGLGVQYSGGRFLLPVWFGGLTSNAGLQWTPAATDLTNTDEGTRSQFTAAGIFSWNQLLGGGLGAAWGRLDLSFGWGIGVSSSHIPGFRVGNQLNVATGQSAITGGQAYAIIGRMRFPDMDVRVINLITGAVETGTKVFSSGSMGPTTGLLNLVERGSSTSDRASAAVAAFWKRALSDEEIDAWLDNPWAILTATGARRWFLLPPPAPPNPVSPDASGGGHLEHRFLARRDRGRQKPGPGAILNWDDPLTGGLSFYVPFLELLHAQGVSTEGILVRDFVTRATAQVPGTGLANRVSMPSRTGIGYLNNGGLGALTFDYAALLDLDDAVGWTPAFKFKIDSIPTVTAKTLFAKDGLAQRHWAFSANITTGTLAFTYGTGTAATTTGNYCDGRWYIAVGFASSTIGALLWIYDENGLLLETVVVSTAPTGVTTGSGSVVNIASGQSDLAVEWMGIWRGRLSPTRQRSLAEQPYRLLTVPTLRVSALLRGVGVSGTISPSGIASAEAFGTPNLVRLALYPIGIDTREVHGTPHIGDIDPSGIASREAFGTAKLTNGDIAPDGIASEEFIPIPELIDTPGAAGTISPSAIASAEVVPSPTLTEVATIRPTGIPSGFDADNPTVRPPVGTIQPFGIESAEGFSEPVSSGLGATGGTTLYTLNNAAPPAAGTVTGKKLCSPFLMLLAGMYDTAPNPAFVLPDVYGDFSVGGLRGPIPAVLVTQTSPWIFIAAAHAVQSIDKVYVDDVEQTAGFVTIPAIALGGGPQVAVIAFTDQPTGEVTWRGKGKMDSTGTLIEDPILQLEDMLLQRGGYSATDFDATALAEAKSKSSLAAWKTAFVFNTTDQIQAWVTEVLFNVMGFWRVTGRAQLQISLDPGGGYGSQDIVDSIVASRDVVDGDDGVTFIADRQQLVNRLVANYRYSWQEEKYTEQVSDETVEDATSMNAYGELRKEVTLRGLRDPTLLAQWAAILFERQAFDTRVEGALVQFQVKGPRLIHATIGDLIAFTWPYGPTREAGHLYINEILRIVQVDQDFTRGGLTSITAVDTGSYIKDGGVRLLTPFSM